MKPLQVNFVGRGAGAKWPSRALLAAACVVSAHAGYSYLATSSAIAERERAAPSQAAAPARAVPAPELAAVRETVHRLGMPWNRLFGALESAATEDVALLGIEPDTKTGTVVISGESKDYLAALSYVLGLSRTEGLAGASLVRHEAKAGDKQGAVSFAVSANWKEAQR